MKKYSNYFISKCTLTTLTIKIITSIIMFSIIQRLKL